MLVWKDDETVITGNADIEISSTEFDVYVLMKVRLLKYSEEDTRFYLVYRPTEEYISDKSPAWLKVFAAQHDSLNEYPDRGFEFSQKYYKTFKHDLTEYNYGY